MNTVEHHEVVSSSASELPPECNQTVSQQNTFMSTEDTPDVNTETTTNGAEEEQQGFTSATIVEPLLTPTIFEIGSQEWIKKVKASIRQLQPPT